jgi:large subunit ribosomal protein L10
MARADKTAAVAELAAEFRSSQAVVLTEYRGLSVKQLTALRRSLGDTVHYAVVKNTLTSLAAKDAGVAGLDEQLVGPSAIAFVKGDPVEAAKGLRDFARANPLLVIKGGVMDGRPLAADEIRKLADLESREVLLAKLAGAMTASLSRAAALFAAPLASTARAVEALRVKAEQDPSVLRGAGQPAAAEEPAAAGQPAAAEEPVAPEAPLAPETPVPPAGEPGAAEPTGSPLTDPEAPAVTVPGEPGEPPAPDVPAAPAAPLAADAPVPSAGEPTSDASSASDDEG